MTQETPLLSSISLPISTGPDEDRVNFINHVEVVRTKLNDLDLCTSNIRQRHVALESVTTDNDINSLHADFRGEIHKANQLIKVVKSQIDALEVSNKDFQARNLEGRESELDLRRVTWVGFSNRLRTSLIGFNKARVDFERLFTERTKNQILKKDLSSSDDGSFRNRDPVARAFLTVQADEEAIKKEDMKRLEKALVEIREAFLQIAALVESQGEMLDCIEFSTVNAKNYAHQANVQLIKARSKQRTRTWLYVYFICTGIIVLVIIILLAAQVLKT